MTTQTHTRTIYAASGRAEKPHCFLLKWNNAKDTTMGRGKNAWHECYAVLFSNGWIATDFGPSYRNLDELTYALDQAGEYVIDWLLDGEASDD